MKDLGEVMHCLGLKISQARPERKLGLNQSKYVTTIFNRFHMAESSPVDTSMKDSRVLESDLAENHVVSLERSQIPY